MRRLLAGGIFISLVPIVNFFFKDENYSAVKTSYTKNPSLKNLLDPATYPGTPLDQRGLFINEEFPYWPKFSDLIKWQTDPNPYKAIKKNYSQRLEVVKGLSPESMPENSLLWLGHASFLIKLSGLKILIDPVLNDLSFLIKRNTDLPVDKKLLKDLNYILISHDHRDHCDEESIKLLARQNPDTTWLCGLELDKLLKKWTNSENIQPAGWYQQYNLQDQNLKISYLPTRHWSRRGLTDTNTTLWGAFMIESNEKKIYFGGDSGFGSHVKKVREIFGKVDLYIAGIGAFAPRWFMAPSHMHPEEVANTSDELKATNLLPMHYGTFDLSDEPLLEPANVIRKLKEQNTFQSNLLLPAIGDVVKV